MDYEKKYNEALEKARKAYNSISPENYGARRIIEDAFPELRENEDERIRKWIIDLLGSFRTKERSTECLQKLDEAIAWLEKQKDASKAIEAVDRIDKYIDEHLANAHDMKDSNPDKKYYRGLDDALGKMAGILQDVYSNEKQKEQKPADEQFPPLEGLDAIKAKYYDDGFKNGFDEGVESVKPAEWSKKDEDMLLSAIEYVQTYPAHRQSVVNWLKSLRPQSHWKLSERDIKMLEHIIGQYETGNKNSKVMGYLPRVEELDFLKKVLAKWKNLL